jgi:hypothetical protein
MPGRRNRSARGDELRGFASPSHGTRSQLEATLAAGGGGGAGGGGAGAPVGGQAGAGGGGVGAADPAASADSAMAGAAAAPAVPFANPFYDENGNIRPGDPSTATPQFDQPLPDDPDFFLRMLYRAHPHPDIAALLTPRSPETLYDGAPNLNVPIDEGLGEIDAGMLGEEWGMGMGGEDGMEGMEGAQEFGDPNALAESVDEEVVGTGPALGLPEDAIPPATPTPTPEV